MNSKKTLIGLVLIQLSCVGMMQETPSNEASRLFLVPKHTQDSSNTKFRNCCASLAILYERILYGMGMYGNMSEGTFFGCTPLRRDTNNQSNAIGKRVKIDYFNDDIPGN